MSMTPKQQQTRRKELYTNSYKQLVKRYCEVSGHLPREVQSDWPESDPRNSRALIDMIVHYERSIP